jgi:hypothetical protein
MLLPASPSELASAQGNQVVVTTVKAMNPTGGQVAPPVDELEMYNLTRDPGELVNLASNSDYAAQQLPLSRMLNEQRVAKHLAPTQQPWANGSLQRFPFVSS